jgi:hypothetical protein
LNELQQEQLTNINYSINKQMCNTSNHISRINNI